MSDLEDTKPHKLPEQPKRIRLFSTDDGVDRFGMPIGYDKNINKIFAAVIGLALLLFVMLKLSGL